MSIPLIVTLKSTQAQMTDPTYVPACGELFVDHERMFLKVGDGVTAFKDLPYMSNGYVSVDTATKPSLSSRAKSIIEENIDLIVNNEFNKLFDKILPPFQVEVAKALIDSGIDLKAHLFPIPRMLQELLSDKVNNLDNKIYTHDYSDQSLDYTQMYTKLELDTKLHELTEEVTKKIYGALGIPAHLMTIKTGE